MVDLDNRQAMAALDRSDMLGHISGFHEQCRTAVDIGRLSRLAVDADRVENIVVLGMGGSGISGDVAKALFDSHCRVPILVTRRYRLPAFVGEKTLTIAVSYSGNTEETLSALDEAVARRSQIVVISSGGRISEVASRGRAGLIKIPAGLQPRAALGYLSIPLLILFEKLQLVGSLAAALDEMVALVEGLGQRYGPDAPESVNPAKQLARKLVGKMPVIYGTAPITALAAFRFKCQVNENAKCPGAWNILPELDHNELAGWQQLKDVSRYFYLIWLRDAEEHDQTKKRVEATTDLIVDQFAGVGEYWAVGASPAARLFSLISLADFTTAYLALLNGLDPSPVERIEQLKRRLV